jgi:hypothetical protein
VLLLLSGRELVIEAESELVASVDVVEFQIGNGAGAS